MVRRIKRLGNGAITLYQCDCKAIDVTAEALVSDPPYGISYKGSYNSNTLIYKQALNYSTSNTGLKGRRFNRPILGDNVPFDPSYWTERYQTVAMTGAQHYYDRLPPGGMFHCWDKRGNYKPLDQADADFIWVKKPGKTKKVSRVLHLVWRGLVRDTESGLKGLHPTQKPIALMEWIIGLCGLPPNSVIFDPYMGVGTTAIAAINLGHRFVGAELEKGFFDLAVERIQKHLETRETNHGIL